MITITIKKSGQFLLTLKLVLSLILSLMLSEHCRASAESKPQPLNKSLIEAKENFLHKIVRNLHAKHLTTDDFYLQVINPILSIFTEEDLNNILEERIDLISSDKRDKAEKMLHFVKVWHTYTQNYHAEMNDYILSKEAFLMQEISGRVSYLKNRLSADRKKSHHKSLEIINKAEGIFKVWNDYKTVVKGDPKGLAKRKYAFEDYFEAITSLEDRLAQKPHGCSPRGILESTASATTPMVLPESSPCYSTFSSFKDFFNSIKNAGKVVSTVIGNKNRSIKDKTPFTDKTSRLFRSLGRYFGYSVSITGEEYLPTNTATANATANAATPAKTINLILPPHRHGIEDAIIMGNMRLHDYAVFANPKTFIPNEYFARLLGDLPEFIAVGNWRGHQQLTPPDKMIASLEKGISHNIFNFPQGFITLTGEILPPNQSFDKKVVHNLLIHGYQVNIIPTVFEVGDFFLSKNGEVEDKQLSARILRPIPPKAVKFLISLEMTPNQQLEQLNSMLLRSLWIENLKKHGDVPVNALIKRMYQRLPNLMNIVTVNRASAPASVPVLTPVLNHPQSL
ncbi:MAG: hypothetical protein HQK53_03685 [Oligoflexia bacterium]|nr:hypothetical protein [Oligoflexia bacterium]